MNKALLLFLVAGCQGPAGSAGPAGDPAERDVHRAFSIIEEDADSGVLASRMLTFTKAAADTDLRLEYFDAFRAYGGSGAPPCSCRWTLQLNGQPCSDPSSIYGEVISVVTEQARTSTVLGWCAATSAGPLTAGEVTVSVSVSTPRGACDCITGLGKVTSVLEAEELK